MNIILIVADTLRRDHLPPYGNQTVLAPNLTAFAESALVFEDCYPASFPTVPTRADLMTGRYTFTYLDWGPLPRNEVTLAQCLSRAGYTTCGVIDTPFMVRNGYGHDRGFGDIIYVRGQGDAERIDVNLWRRAEEDYCAPRTFREAADWLERHHKEQFFLYVDTWDPHEPWDPPHHYVTPYLPDYQGEVIPPPYWDYAEDGITERELAIAHACYCGEISMVDRWFGHLMERVRTLGLLENTAIIFLSDHGFYFGEHGQFGKRRFRWPDNLPFEQGFLLGRTLADGYTFRSPLHNEVTQVPLLMHLPGQGARRVPGLVSLPDLMPTVLDLADVAIPDRVQAHSILPLARGESASPNSIAVTSAPFEELGGLSKTVDDRAREVLEASPSTITNGEWDLLYGVHGDPVELYRTRADPQHRHNRIETYGSVAEQLHAQFVAWLEAAGTAPEILAPRRRL
ncbi:MAG: sulfatase [Caldilineaceae bacterium]